MTADAWTTLVIGAGTIIATVIAGLTAWAWRASWNANQRAHDHLNRKSDDASERLRKVEQGVATLSERSKHADTKMDDIDRRLDRMETTEQSMARSMARIEGALAGDLGQVPGLRKP